MNKRHLSLLAAASIALFSACSNIVESTDSQSTLRVLVKDQTTGAAVTGATVKLVASGDSKTTDASGYVSFGGVSVGDVALRVDANGYASVIVAEKIEGDPSIPHENSTIVQLPKAVALTGSAYYEDEYGSLHAAEGATIRIALDEEILVNRILETKVGADGKYTFTLPVNAEGAAWGLEQKFGDVTYAITGKEDPSLWAGTTPSIGDIIYRYSNRAAGKSFELLGNRVIRYPASTDSSETITLNFTDAIDIAKSHIIEVKEDITDNILAADIDYGDGKTVTIKPVGGKWVGDFYITNNGLTSVDGVGLSGFEVYVLYDEEQAPLEGKVIGVGKKGTIDATSTTAIITWDAKKDADDYRVFGMSTLPNGSKSYALLSSGSPTCATETGATKKTCSATVDVSGSTLGIINSDNTYGNAFAGGGKVNIVVQAYNSFNQSNSDVFLLAP